ncbi:ABC transporter ATP-binding protein [Gilvimarinus polysaccharolyticus]|uniref:ABC transporter ATP-binding protein n=1 Tax=Gilvimarinus polysaccharolyticus TaxID=863921 RepID=UPI0006734A06|nr:ABC transporter ATP-binding protein [Gilvimarinus polysaccharolyticus]
MIELEDLTVGYFGEKGSVLQNLNIQTHSGLVCLLGRNGTGKSTLLRTLAGLQQPLAGQVTIAGQNIHVMNPVERARQVAVVLTERQFGLGLTVEDAVSMGRHPHTGWRGQLNDADKKHVYNALKITQAQAFAGRYLDDLSDGEKQRVMIARAIAQNPTVMLLDEITAFLDLPGRVASMLLLKQYAAENAATIILSSHDLELSLQLADTIWLLDGKGKCRCAAPQELLQHGYIGDAFDSDMIAYSQTTGQFELLDTAAKKHAL